MEYKDFNLIPRVVSSVKSRDDIKVEVKFDEHLTLSCPIISSPMKDVTNGDVASKMVELGGLGIIHRFMSCADQVNHFNTAKKNGISACAMGIDNDYDVYRLDLLYYHGCRVFCIDVANGANTNVGEFIKSISEKHPDISLIVGNVASKECYQYLEGFPTVKAIRVGIAGGKSCTTKNATGIYHPMASCVKECASVKQRTLLIADGGIREPGDMCKAIALGADCVMLGSLIANTIDSPAERLNQNGKDYTIYHGSASFEVQKLYKDKPKYVEGKCSLLEYHSETLEDLVGRFMDGLKSSMSYLNSLNFTHYRHYANC